MIDYRSIQLSGPSVAGHVLSVYWIFFIFGLYIIHRLVTASFRTGNFSIYDKENSKFIDYPKAVNKIVLWAALGWQVGGRIGYVALNFEKASFQANPFWIIYALGDGLSSSCAVIGAFLTTAFIANRLKLNTLKLMDILSFITPTFIFLVRISEFMTISTPGRPTNIVYGVIFPGYGDIPRHPLRLYQALAEGLLLQIILIANKKQFSHRGRMTCLFLLGYAVLGDIVASLFRDFEIQAENMIGIFSFRQIVTLCLASLAFYISFIRQTKLQRGKVW